MYVSTISQLLVDCINVFCILYHQQLENYLLTNFPHKSTSAYRDKSVMTSPKVG